MNYRKNFNDVRTEDERALEYIERMGHEMRTRIFPLFDRDGILSVTVDGTDGRLWPITKNAVIEWRRLDEENQTLIFKGGLIYTY